jgi:hypothetical protein
MVQGGPHGTIRPRACPVRVKEDRVDLPAGAAGSNEGMRILVLATLLLAAERDSVSVTVVDAGGHPLPHVLLFAADASKVIAMAQSDERGSASLPSPHPRYNFGLVSPSMRLHSVIPQGSGHYQLVTASLPAGLAADHDVARLATTSAQVFHGRVLDETGAGLAGVRVEAARSGGAVACTTFSGAGGRFALVVPGGQYGVRAAAPGLYAVSGELRDGELVLVMAVAAAVETISVTDGHTLSFRQSDSIDPEYTPPAPVRAWLSFTYGICPSLAPLKAHEKRGLKKYWYLDVLRTEPPNPATVSVSACSPPSQAMQTLGMGRVEGFDIWEEGVVTRPSR